MEADRLRGRPLMDAPCRQPTKSSDKTCPGLSCMGSTVITPPMYMGSLLKFSVLKK
jgi:hypothetical protein